jgi:hypothetical protein
LVKVIVGKKGSGKTKMLIDMVNHAVSEDHGSIVCIEAGRNLTYDIKYSARLIDIYDYPIAPGVDTLFAFLCAIYAGNFDVTHIFIDSLQKASHSDDMAEFGRFAKLLDEFGKKHNIKFTFMLSCDRDAAEKYLAEYL